jgi:hypothetical protein
MYTWSTDRVLAATCDPRNPVLHGACGPDTLPKIRRFSDAPSKQGERSGGWVGALPAPLFGLALAISLWALAGSCRPLHAAPPARLTAASRSSGLRLARHRTKADVHCLPYAAISARPFHHTDICQFQFDVVDHTRTARLTQATSRSGARTVAVLGRRVGGHEQPT